jgi:hypothetical protein
MSEKCGFLLTDRLLLLKNSGNNSAKAAEIGRLEPPKFSVIFFKNLMFGR